MFRLGLVGVGKMGVSHLAIARAHPELECVAVCDSQPFVLAGVRSQLGVDTYRSFDNMVAEAGLDAVIVSTPTSSHVALARKALESDLAVFVEKPLTLNSADSRGLAELAQQRGLANQVGYHNRFIGTFRETRRLVESGAIGDVHHIDGRAFGQVVTKPQGGGRTWRSKKSEGGGCLHDYACHVIDLMNFVVGHPAEVTGAKLAKIHSANVEDAVYAMFRYANGAIGTLETNWSDESYRKMTTSLTIYGSHGKIQVDRQECRLYLKPGHTFEKFETGWTTRYITELQEPVAYYLRGEEYSAQLDAFADALSGTPSEQAGTFATAAESDWVVEEIARLDQQAPVESVEADAGEGPDIVSME
ncbi:MAG: Gfo/Idh/MocA family protein, partial [Acidimicrobiales bacterium]